MSKVLGGLSWGQSPNIVPYIDFVGVEKRMQKKNAGQYNIIVPCILYSLLCFCIDTNVAELVVNQTRMFVQDMAQILWSFL